MSVLQELSCTVDDRHGPEDVDYLVIEAGDWLVAADEQDAFAGASATGSTRFAARSMQLSGAGDAGDGWAAVDFASVGFGGVPVVLSQVQTFAEGTAVITRHRQITNSSVHVRLQEDNHVQPVPAGGICGLNLDGAGGNEGYDMTFGAGDGGFGLAVSYDTQNVADQVVVCAGVCPSNAVVGAGTQVTPSIPAVYPELQWQCRGNMA